MREPVITLRVRVGVDHCDLYSACYDAWEHANTGPYKPGENYWMTMFADKLKEMIDGKHVSIGVEKIE